MFEVDDSIPIVPAWDSSSRGHPEHGVLERVGLSIIMPTINPVVR